MRSMLPDDATTRSRIRDTAIVLFGRNGYAATSIRAIAEAAGVSPGLVIHHFSSKEKLRLACDEYIVAEVIGRGQSLDDADLQATMQRWLGDMAAYRGVLDYLTRMLLEESVLGDRLFDRLLASTQSMLDEGVTRGVMNPSDDPRMRAVILTTHGLATLLLERHIGRAFGEGGLTETVIRRMTLPSLELYTYGLYRDDSTLAAARKALEETATKGAGAP